MPQSTVETDVLIVGAGPVGLFLANECARRGIRCKLIEAKSTQSEHSKALAIFPRTLEIFDMAGVAAPFIDAANRVTSVEVIAHGRVLAHMPFIPEGTPYPFIAMVPQNVTEKLLVEQLRRKGGAIEYDTSFVSAVQHQDFVRVTLEHKGRRQDMTAAWVVGCDGAHSAVRHVLNLPFEGAAYHDLFMLADIETNDTLPADQLQLCPNEDGPLAIFPISSIRRRIVATVKSPEGDAPSLDLVRKLLKQRAPAGIEAYKLIWSSYFHIHHRHVAQLRQGRMFLAGDAAHIHSPFGAQGMNTGLQDVWNLVWKLDLVLGGHADGGLLDTYTTERLPVIKHVIGISDFLTRVMATPNKFAQALRDTVIPMVSRLTPFQHAFVQKLSELGIAYHGSPIVEGPGERYLTESMRGGKGILRRFLLALDDDAESSVVDAAKQLVESFPDIVALRMEKRKGMALIRPDGYSAFSESEDDGVPALEKVRSIIESQIT